MRARTQTCIFLGICIILEIVANPLRPGDDEWRDVSDSELGNFTSAAISIDGRPCAKIGMDILRIGGSVVDAAIAAQICNGLFNPHSMGIGGGFFMTYYDRANGQVIALDARETAPSYVFPDMFDGNTTAPRLSPLGVAIPGQLKGLYEAKQRFGSPEITWQILLEPSIDMCRNGIEVGFSLAENMADEEEAIRRDPGLSSLFINPDTNELLKTGDTFLWPAMADTLELISSNGPEDFYYGIIASNLVTDIANWGGNITLDDLASYEVVWKEPISVDLEDDLTFYGVPPPASGVILAYILDIVKHFNFTQNVLEDNVLYQRVVEAFKWAYASRTKLGDPFDDEIEETVNELVANLTSGEMALAAFGMINDTFTVNNASYYGAEYSTPEDQGTSHMSILAPNGDALSLTSTINLKFGVKYMSPSTGIILNNEMDDFSYPNVTNYFGVPPSPSNYAKAGKRPLSSMCPSIVVNKTTGNVRLIVGASGGTKITTASAWATLRNLWLGQDIKESIDIERVHHQLAPMQVSYHPGTDQSILDLLDSIGHPLAENSYIGIVNAVSVENGQIFANADYRKDGGIDGF